MKKHSLLLILCLLCTSHLSTYLYAQCVFEEVNVETEMGTTTNGGTLVISSGNGEQCEAYVKFISVYVSINDVCSETKLTPDEERGTVYTIEIPKESTYIVYSVRSNGDPKICDPTFTENPPPGCTLTEASCTDPCAPFNAATCECLRIDGCGVSVCELTAASCTDPCAPFDAEACACVQIVGCGIGGCTLTAASCTNPCAPFDAEACACVPIDGCGTGGCILTAADCTDPCAPFDASACACVPVREFQCPNSIENCRGEVTPGGISICGECEDLVPPTVVDFLCTSEPSCTGATNTVISICGVCPTVPVPPCPVKCNTTCPPFTYQDPFTCICVATGPGNECIPYGCDDGDPCTTGDSVKKNSLGIVCEPCAGQLIAIESIVVENMRDCNDNGTSDPSDDTYTGDIVVTFNHSPVIEDFIITGDAYYSYKEDYCEVNGNKILIPSRTLVADGEMITLHGILNDRVTCSYTKNGLAGTALSCSATGAAGATVDCIKTLDPSADASACIYAITIDEIYNIYDNGSIYNTSDDYIQAKVTVHFGSALPTKGVLELSGIVSTHVDLAKVNGSSYTFPDRLELAYKNGNTLKVVAADYHSSHSRICPITEYCSYTEAEVFLCDPSGSSYISSEDRSSLWYNTSNLDLHTSRIPLTGDMTVFPNPAREFVFVTLSDAKIGTGKVNIEVYDMAGKLQVSKVTDYQNAPIQVNLSELNAGLYLIRLEQSGKVFTDRIIKAN